MLLFDVQNRLVFYTLMAVDVVHDLARVESDGFDHTTLDLQEAFPFLGGAASDELHSLVDAWGKFTQAVHPIKKMVGEIVDERKDSPTEHMRRELSLVNEFTATGVWQGRNAPSVLAVWDAQLAVLDSLTEVGLDGQDAWDVVQAVRILANGGVLHDETEELSR